MLYCIEIFKLTITCLSSHRQHTKMFVHLSLAVHEKNKPKSSEILFFEESLVEKRNRYFHLSGGKRRTPFLDSEEYVHY